MYELPPDPAPQHTPPVATVVGFEAALVPTALVLGWLVGVKPLQTLMWSEHALLWGLAATLPLFLGLWMMLQVRRGPLARLIAVLDRSIIQWLRNAQWWELAILSAMAGIGEELLFRGLVQQGLAQWTGNPWLALAISSVLFGLMHAVTRTYALLASVVGLYFGYLWMATDNLLVPIVAHGVYDFGALLWLINTADRRLARRASEGSPDNDA
jgi:membrane protease YdiL (CAAX protease family)